MEDSECVAFLRWCLPRLGLRWAGFRKVRRQVCRRVGRRIAELGLAGADAYRGHLEGHPREWRRLDSSCRITISRFFRDRGVFAWLESEALPELARRFGAASGGLRCWSLGTASGEEAYSLAMLWRLGAGRELPRLRFRVFATDADERMLERARAGRYGRGSLRDVPAAWVGPAFARRGEEFRLRPRFRRDVQFVCQDIRRRLPRGRCHLLLCRNLAFTYFDESLQGEVLNRLARRLAPGGYLVLGAHETLPDSGGFERPAGPLPVYRRRESGPERGGAEGQARE